MGAFAAWKVRVASSQAILVVMAWFFRWGVPVDLAQHFADEPVLAFGHGQQRGQYGLEYDARIGARDVKDWNMADGIEQGMGSTQRSPRLAGAR